MEDEDPCGSVRRAGRPRRIDYRLRPTFEDRTVGDVDFTGRDWRGVFEPLIVREPPPPAAALYRLLSIYAHPQAFSSRGEARFDGSGATWMEPDVDKLRWACAWVIVAWVDAAGHVMGWYHGWDVGEQFDALLDAANEVMRFE